MKIIKLTLLFLILLFNSCKSPDSTIERTTISYEVYEKTTSVNDFLVLNPIKIKGKWEKTYYIDENNTKKKNYFLYLKQDKNILGLFFKKNSVSKTNLTEKEYFTKTIVKEFEMLGNANLKYTIENSDDKSYQTCKYKDINNIDFHGLIGIKNKVIYYLTIQNDLLNDIEKEKFLIEMFTTMKP